MPWLYEKIAGFAGGLVNRYDPRDIKLRDPRGLSKAQNISLDVGGKIRTIGGLEDFTKVDGTTALTQTAKLCPGASLFTYGSDHWRGTDTIGDSLSQLNAASDHDADNDGPDATTGWSTIGGPTVESVADTDGATIASNGTSYIIKMTLVGASGGVSQSFTTVVGQKYKIHVDLYCKTATSYYFVRIVDPYITGPYNLTAFWVENEIEFVATQTTTEIRIQAAGAIGQIVYFDDAYATRIPRRDLDTNWLALADVANAQVDLYNVNDDSFTAGLLDFGTVSSYVATVDTINFPTTNTITDSTSQFLNQGIQAGDIRIISGCTTQTANNIMFVVEHVSAGTITTRGNPFTVAADEDGTVTLTKYNPVAFHYVNEALRASPADGGIALRPKHYSFVDRIHFEGADSSEREWSNWYANDVGPVAPTDVAFDAAVDSGLSGNLTAGAGWEVGMTVNAKDGEWTAGTYILACSFIYDDGQESALYVPSTDVAMTAITEGASLTLCAKADTATNYDERISGGRVYCRIDETDDPWTLLMDISMAKGARASTLSTNYNAWAEGATADDVYTASFISKRMNSPAEEYEPLSGADPTTPVEVFNGDNAFWNTSVIARNRCFIGSVRYTAEGGSLAHFRDQILYSTSGAFDTFPIDNYIDVVQGDAEDYKKLGVYGNVILAFKEKTLYLIDISDPDPAGWQMLQDANKGKYPRRGVRHPGAYFETPHGPAWCNEFGVFLYTGNKIVELLKDRMELSEHPLAYQRYYEFDGTDDVITKSDDSDLDMGVTDFSIEAIVRSDVADDACHEIYTKGQAATPNHQLRLDSSNKFSFTYDDGTASTAQGNSAITTKQWYHVVGAADRSETDGTVLYVNGAAQTTTGDGRQVTLDNAIESSIGRGTSTLFWDGEIALVRVWNRKLTAAEVLALYNGQPVLAADKWGVSTALITGDDSDMDTAGNWAAFGAATVTGGYDSGDAGYDKTLRIQAGDGSNEAAQLAAQFTLTSGKKYRLRFNYKHIETTSVADPYNMARIQNADGTNSTYLSQAISATWATFEQEFTATGANTVLKIRANAATGDAANEVLIDNVTLVQIGCVAEWAPKGIGDATWEDQSTNSLDGTVVGATAIYEDSWAKFYTDYSILGYHARTNSIPIMRDCTGKWSSGQDYGDCLIIDLDTGAVTTGRRIFTKGIAYSNWATDWNQDLIIAEQTSSTSVTIKRWTDEPQSQAAGLIDIRTADIDFGNPAYAKFFDALVAYYKSSAAQTTPFSYAIDGDDRHTAWTRLTGNFTAEGFWEKLTLEPTTFECDTIRLKLDNPTNAGTMELNDLTLRYQTEEEDID